VSADDQSNDVQSVAVKCLAIITKKVQQAQIGDVCKKLISLILEGKDALRDVYSIGLKTLIADVPDSMGGALVSDRLTAKLLSGISRQDAEDIQRECLDNMADLLRRFGHLNASAHHEIMSAVVKQLQSDRAVIRKRAAHCLGALVVVSSDALLNSLVQILLEGIEASTSATSQSTRTLIQTIGTISRTVGYRLGRHLERIVPLFLRFCGDPEDENQQNDAANELRESCFPGEWPSFFHTIFPLLHFSPVILAAVFPSSFVRIRNLNYSIPFFSSFFSQAWSPLCCVARRRWHLSWQTFCKWLWDS